MLEDTTAGLALASEVAVRQCLAVRPGETVLVVTDPGCEKVGRALWLAASGAGAEALFLLMKPRRVHGEEPPLAVAEAMKRASVCFAATTYSLTHTAARRDATSAGTRVASLPGITEEVMARAVLADCESLAVLTERIARILDRARTVRMLTALGTDLSMNVAGRQAVRDTGRYTTPGAFGNLPAGEACVAPIEGSVSGRVVVDGSVAGVGRVDAPVTLEIAGGKVASISGGTAAERVRMMLESVGGDARVVGEFGIGTNASAQVSGHTLEDEKVLGTAHVALGANASLGGTIQVGCHIDLVVLEPDVWVDDVQIMREGKLVELPSQ